MNANESELPASARVVVIGAGIVGNCLVGHLGRLGWSDMVLIDKGPLPNPGGSTGHASNFIFPVDHNKEVALLSIESSAQYSELGLADMSGGIEVARTPERMDELRRRMTSAMAWGVEAQLLSPSEVKDLVPFVNEDVILGGFYCPGVSVVDSVETGTRLRNEATNMGTLRVVDQTEVLDLVTSPSHVPGQQQINAVVTNRGTVEAEHVVIACGVWSNRIANLADAFIPLVPAVHQMADVGPIDILTKTDSLIGYPIVRDMDTFCYERQANGAMEVGSYAHRPILHHPDDIPSNDEATRSPTEMPFTPDDFDPQMGQAIELMSMLEAPEITYAINGLLSLTPDAMPCLGELPSVRNLWAAAAVWIKEGPAAAQVLAEWMTYGYPRVLDPHGADVARFYAEETSDEHIWARASEHFNKTYGIVHPAEQWESRRQLRISPYFSRQESLGAEFVGARVWERPHWYESNADLVDRYDVADRDVEWDQRWWSSIINGEHLNLREHAGLFDLSAFQIFDLDGPGAVAYAEHLSVNKVDKPVGSSTYTPWLTAEGGIRADLTVLRLGHETVRIVTGAFEGGRDEFWIKKHLPTDGSVRCTNRTNDITTLGLWGPKAANILGQLTDADLTQVGSPYGSVREIDVSGLTVSIHRISYVGEPGWEISLPWDDGPTLWDTLLEAGRAHGLRPTGSGVYSTTGRIEKGYRLMGADLESEYNPIEAGLARPMVKAADFIGKEAYVAARLAGPAAMLCTLTVEDLTDSAGQRRFPQAGSAPLLTLDGERILDSKGRASRVTSAADGPSVGQYLLMGYLPPDLAVTGTPLQVLYANETFPVRVAAVSDGLFDPGDTRLRK